VALKGTEDLIFLTKGVGMRYLSRALIAALGTLYSGIAFADLYIPIFAVGKGTNHQSLGYVTAHQTSRGVLFVPYLHDLPPGRHGFHVHNNPSCADEGIAAGDHLDPVHTAKHLGPFENGHLGDLPVLWVPPNGKAMKPVLAPHLRLSELTHHSLVIHKGGDNYSDSPVRLGGGDGRIACGVIP
jgi:Cu-Zn family superoxide dismutase